MLNRSIHFHSLALAALFWVGCNGLDQSANLSQDGASQNGVIIQPLAKAAGAGEADLHQAMAVQNRHSPELLSLRGVVGNGAGVDENGNPAVVVFIEQPGVTGIPDKLEGMPVRVVVTGRIEAVQPMANQSNGKGGKPGGGTGCTVNPASRFSRPVPIGVSTGHPQITAGTLGVRVKNASGQLFALSNNHVFANINQGPLGINVLQPGAYDGGVNHVDSIGSLAAFETINFCDASGNCPSNTIDAAIASTTSAQVGNATPCDGYGTPKAATVTASIGMAVKKYGRTTGQTSSKISAVNVSIKVSYGTGLTALFTGQVYIGTPGFSAGGDSGSLIVSDAGNPVALLFAGSSNSTIGNPIGAVLTRFGVTIDGT